jgi:hypothetical protein
VATESDVYRAASLLIAEYGELAAVGAAVKADHLAQQGNRLGQAVWLRVARAVEELLDDERPCDATVN